MKKRLRMTSFLLAGLLMAVQISGCSMADKLAGGVNESSNGAADGVNESSNGAADGVNESASQAADVAYDGSVAEMETEEAKESVAAMEEMNTEEYSAITENGFTKASLQPVSTFSADVDTASYSNVRRMLNQGMSPEEISEDAVRIEEMLNYFSYDYETPENGEIFGIDYETPENGEIFGISIDGADCPWNEEHGLIRIGIQTEEIDFSETPKSNLVFLLDVSGSMDDANKLPLLKQAFSMLVDNLGEKDRVSIVTYAGADAVVLDGARGNEKGEILEALNFLEAGGGTNGSAGIETAYALAEAHFIQGGNNRVILATDGDLNIGVTSESDLKEMIEEKKESGIYLSVLGFGDGNLKDNKLETLADCGNGNYAYIDSLMEAKRVLVDEMGSTLVTVAEDVKFQLEFNSSWIAEYRLLGYENRLLEAEDFTDDTKDAGEIGAGHTVTVLYEVVWAGSEETSSSGEDIELKYQNIGPADGEAMKEWATLKIRYKEPGASQSKEIERAFGSEIYKQDVKEAKMLLEASVAEFGMLLRDSEYKGNSSYEHILSMWSDMMYGGNREVAEFLQLVKIAAGQADMCDGVPLVYEEENGITLQILEETITNSGATFLLKNSTEMELCYGEYYEMQKLENGEWVSLNMKENVGFHDIAYILSPGAENQLDIQWKWVYGTLSPGTYRFQTEVFYSNISEEGTAAGNVDMLLSVEFEIAE